jgi:hypothetical protein
MKAFDTRLGDVLGVAAYDGKLTAGAGGGGGNGGGGVGGGGGGGV